MLLRKQSLEYLNLEAFARVNDQEFATRLQAMNIHIYASWLLPQLVAYFGQWRLQSTGRDTLANNCKTELDWALYRLTRVKRSILIKNQTQNSEYGTFTPLILLGFKRNQGFSYEQFRDLPGLSYLLEPDLYEAVVLNETPQLSVDTLLKIRQEGLVYKSGKDLGKSRLAESTWRLYGIQGTEIGQLPLLTQSMLCQIWLAHPKHRRNTMILDLLDWDSMPEALIDTDIVEVKKPKVVDSEWVPPWLTTGSV